MRQPRTFVVVSTSQGGTRNYYAAATPGGPLWGPLSSAKQFKAPPFDLARALREHWKLRARVEILTEAAR